jgi:hypothetical protein
MCKGFEIPLRKIVNFPLNDKLTLNSDRVSKPVLFILFTFFLLFSFASYSQVERPVRPPEGQLPATGDTLDLPPDSLVNESDSLQVKTDSVEQVKKGDVETTIIYSARDSINSTFNPKIIRLYGEAKIKYGSIELEAEDIVIDYDNSTISASGRLDSAGRRVGFPIFKDNGAIYETRDMVYNFKTRRAQISEVVTQQGDGFIHGEKVFKNEKNELFSIGNAYTTCNRADPHFRIISRRSKAIPADKIVSGPFYMELNHVPTPLGFPFAIFPQPRESASGIIFPTYGEEKVRGFFLRGGGYFFDISDYMKLTILGDIYTKGSNAITVSSQYMKRYKYSGNVSFNLTNNKLSPNIEETGKIHDFRVTWSHSPQTKSTGRFAVSVNAATNTYTQNNYLGVSANPQSMAVNSTSRKLSSNVSYSKTFAGTPFSFGTNLRINQDLVTKQVDLPFPDLSFNMNNIYPFKNSESYFLSNINFRLTSTANNLVSNNVGRTTDRLTGQPIDSIAPFTFENIPTFFRNAKKGVRHDFPLQTSIRLLRFFTLSPAIAVQELWYFEKLNWGLNSDSTDAAVIDTVHQFNRVTNYSGGLSMNTRIYGTWINKKRDGHVKAIRHVMNPNVGFQFQPDFSDPKYDYYQSVTTKTGRVIYRSRHEGFVYGSSQMTESRSLNFGIGNTLEMKVRSEKDTVDRKISLLNSFSINTGYNLAADSFKLAPIQLAANTNVLDGKINVNVSGTIDPYIYRLNSIDEMGVVGQRHINQFVWTENRSLGQLTNMNLAVSTNLSPKGREKDQTTREKIAQSDLKESDKQFLMQNPDAYIDFDIPWNLRINYTFDYTKRGFEKPKVVQAIRFSGDLSITEKWKVDFNSGFDFERKAFTTSNFGIRRDLHCWQMSVNWVPFGRFQSYNFSIGIKSGMLQDLKLDRNRSFVDAQ